MPVQCMSCYKKRPTNVEECPKCGCSVHLTEKELLQRENFLEGLGGMGRYQAEMELKRRDRERLARGE